MTLLTKSKYLNGLQCPKLLWTVINDKESIPEVDAATQHKFDQGNLINEYSRKWFPDGIQLSEDDYRGNLEKTKELLKERKPLFEPGFQVGNLYARADILVPVGEDEWDIIEVKSSTQVKEINIHDVAFQKYVYTKFGLKIRDCYLMFINNEYVRQGEIDPKQLLKTEKISAEVDKFIKDIRIDKMFEIIALEKCPEVKIGPHCSDPYACALTDTCWAFLPEHNIFNLYYGGKKSWSLFDSDILDIKDIPADFKLSSKQEIQKDCVVSGKDYVDKEGLGMFLSSLEYPIYYLDFETINPAVPLFDSVRPYQQIPFQFSLHIEQEDGSLEHHEFLFVEKGDPRPTFLEALKKVLGDSGTILAFNQSFEIGRLRECAEVFPEYKQWYDELLPRFVDLITPFKDFLWHSPKQNGSNSIKAVLPAITGKGYDELEIGDGGTASRAYLEMMYSDLSDKEKIRVNLLKYCGLDTEGMVWVVKELRGV